MARIFQRKRLIIVAVISSTITAIVGVIAANIWSGEHKTVIWLNSEANLNVLDRRLALVERRAFERDRLRSRLITRDEWLRRPVRAGSTVVTSVRL